MTAPQNPYAPPAAGPSAPFDLTQPPVGHGVPAQQGDPAGHGQSSAAGAPDIASPWLRLGACLLNAVLAVVTLGIGFVIWTLVLWGQSTSPGKKVLGLKVVHADTGADVNRNHMAIRGLLIPVAFSCVPVLGSLISLVDALFIFRDGARPQRLTDRLAHTLVVRA